MAKTLELIHEDFGICEKLLVRSDGDGEDIKNEWSEKYGELFSQFKVKVVEEDRVNPFMVEQKLNWCKYELIIYERRIKTIVTENINREVVLMELLNSAKEKADILGIKHKLTFTIYLTENGVKSLLIDSKKDIEFINFIYENSR